MRSSERGDGCLVAIEGIDGAGKTTHTHQLLSRLTALGVDAERFREPGDSPAGGEIRKLALSGRNLSPEEELALFIEDRKIDVATNIKPALKRGAIVIMDRYYFSSMAYQGALGINAQEIRRRNEAFAPVPNMTVILDIAPAEGIRRIRQRLDTPNTFETEDYLQRVREQFNSFRGPGVEVISSEPPIKKVHATVFELVSRVVFREEQRAARRG